MVVYLGMKTKEIGMKTIENVTKAYDSLIKLVKKNNNLVDVDIRDLIYKKDRDLLRIKLNLLGFNITYLNRLDYIDIQDNVKYVYFKDGDGRRISISDCGSQPKNEELIKFSFSTGAYCLGGHYDTKTFIEFFSELMKYKYKYSDIRNNSLYFELDEGAKLYSVFNEILEKYRILSQERNKQNEIDELKKKIEDLGCSI